jgi:hypothetical protein
MLPLRIKIFSAFLKMEVQGHHLPQARCNSSTLLSMPPSLLHFPSRPASFATEGFGCSSHPSTSTYCRSTSENVAQAPDGKPFANCARKPGGLNSSSRAPHSIVAACGGDILAIVPAARAPSRWSDQVPAIFRDSLWRRRHPACGYTRSRVARTSWRIAD